eukprot:3489492-Rhodomonas_salina.5
MSKWCEVKGKGSVGKESTPAAIFADADGIAKLAQHCSAPGLDATDSGSEISLTGASADVAKGSYVWAMPCVPLDAPAVIVRLLLVSSLDSLQVPDNPGTGSDLIEDHRLPFLLSPLAAQVYHYLCWQRTGPVMTRLTTSVAAQNLSIQDGFDTPFRIVCGAMHRQSISVAARFRLPVTYAFATLSAEMTLSMMLPALSWRLRRCNEQARRNLCWDRGRSKGCCGGCWRPRDPGIGPRARNAMPDTDIASGGKQAGVAGTLSALSAWRLAM